jgi:NADH-quinone oxidoreductase subunit M
MLLAAVALASAAHPRRVVWLAIGGLLVVLSVQLLAGRAVLADGTSVARGFALPEMARVAHAAGTVKLAFVLLFAGAMILAGIFPLHPWLPQTEDASIVALVPKLGAYALVRVGFMVMPEGVRWAAGAVVAFGAITVVYAALCARAEKRLVRFAAYATMAQMGLVFVGLGSLTPQGIGGAMFACFAHGLATPLLLASARMLESRARTSEIARFGGLSRETPVLAVVLAVALLSSMGAPATAGLWGSLLPVLGAFPIHRVLAGVAALGIVLVAAAHAHALRTMLFGSLDARWRSSEELEPFGGRLPDAGARDLVLVAPLVVLVVVLGVWPAPLFGVLSGAVSDIASAVNPPGPSQIALLFP